MPDSSDLDLIPVPEDTRAAVADLVDRYRRNEDQYRRPSYNEAQCRQEFINPFFEALGWDVRNLEGAAEAYKDVVHEASVKVGGDTKAPDYSFRVGGTRKFFLEAKKPSVHIRDDAGPAYQLRRYAWGAKLPLSILTDFDELAVYDCRKRPKSGARTRGRAAPIMTAPFRCSSATAFWSGMASRASCAAQPGATRTRRIPPAH